MAMMMFRSHRYQPLLRLIFQTTSPLPTPQFYPFPFSLKFCTTTSQSHSLTVSYLINNLGFTPQIALKASKRLRFETSEKPDIVLDFFRSHGFSDSQGIGFAGRLVPIILFLYCKSNKKKWSMKPIHLELVVNLDPKSHSHVFYWNIAKLHKCKACEEMSILLIIYLPMALLTIKLASRAKGTLKYINRKMVCKNR